MIKNIIKYVGISLFVVFFISACAKKTLNIISKDSLYEKGLEYTLINDIVYKNDTKAIMNITYLNASEPNEYDYKYHEFLIGIYIDDINEGLQNKQYILSMNSNTKYIQIPLKKDHPLYNHIPVKNPYAIYYIIKFKKGLEKTLSLKLSHKKFGNANIIYKRF